MRVSCILSPPFFNMGDEYKYRDRYHKPGHYKRDNDEGVREVEKFMVEECERRKIDWSTVNKYKFAEKLKCHKEYFNMLAEKRIHN